MKGLRLAIAPFAPDQSGASSVLFNLDGIVVICDAGGCAGNVCAFDEPRWFNEKSAIFSAGLRDMDAILGRDDKLVAKLKDTADKLDCKFIAIIGTPVPAVIATDYNALCKMSEDATNLPVIAMDTTGVSLYDKGASKSYLALFKRFMKKDKDIKSVKGKVGVLGITPLDYYEESTNRLFHEKLKEQGYKQIVCYGYENGLKDYEEALSVEKNIVVAPSGLAAAKYLEENFNIPYEIGCPIAKDIMKENFDNDFDEMMKNLQDKKVLIVHQQIMANAMREVIENYNPKSVTVASWFMMKDEIKRNEDIYLTEEDQWQDLSRDYDVIIGDDSLKKAIPKFKGEWISMPHYAVSGQIGRKVVGCNYKYESTELCKA